MASRIEYSEKYMDDKHEYRWAFLLSNLQWYKFQDFHVIALGKSRFRPWLSCDRRLICSEFTSQARDTSQGPCQIFTEVSPPYRSGVEGHRSPAITRLATLRGAPVLKNLSISPYWLFSSSPMHENSNVSMVLVFLNVVDPSRTSCCFDDHWAQTLWRAKSMLRWKEKPRRNTSNSFASTRGSKGG